MTIYVSGKISGMPIEKAKENFRNASFLVRAAGHVDKNPMELVPFNPEWKWTDYMRKDVKILCDCDAILMQPNWILSKGAKIELLIAYFLGIKIIWYNDILTLKS